MAVSEMMLELEMSSWLKPRSFLTVIVNCRLIRLTAARATDTKHTSGGKAYLGGQREWTDVAWELTKTRRQSKSQTRTR